MAVRDLRLSADSPALVRQLARDGRRRVLSGATPSAPTYAPATAAPGEPRDAHWVNLGTEAEPDWTRALLVEPSATNLVPESRPRSAAVWTSAPQAAPPVPSPFGPGEVLARVYDFNTRAVVPVTAGTTYTLSAWVLTDEEAARPRLTVSFFDAGDAQIGSATSAVFDPWTPGAWGRVQVTATAPTGAVTALVYLLNNDVSDSTLVWFDGVQFEVGTTPSSYVPTYGAPATRAADVASKALAAGDVRLTWLDAALAEQTATVAHGGGTFTIPVGTGRRYLTVEHDAGSGFTTILDFPAGDTLAAEGWGFARASAATYTARNPSSPTGWLSARAYDWRRVYPGGRLPSLTGSGTAQVMGADDTVSTSDPDPALHGLSFDAGDRMSSVTALGAAWTVLWRERVAGVTRVYAETSTGVQYVDGAAGAHGRTLPTPTVLQTAGGLSGRVLGAWASHDAVLAPADVAAESARLAAL